MEVAKIDKSVEIEPIKPILVHTSSTAKIEIPKVDKIVEAEPIKPVLVDKFSSANFQPLIKTVEV